MPYITTKREAHVQVTFEELLAGPVQESAFGDTPQSATWTYLVREPRPEFLSRFALQGTINTLAAFNRKHAELFEKPRGELYRTFHIPKKGRGLDPLERYEDGVRRRRGIISNLESDIATLKRDGGEDAMRRCIVKEKILVQKREELKKYIDDHRKIDAPKDELMLALRELKQIFERDCFALYHTSAYAYVPGRCTIDALKCHQRNKSNWYCKLDFANFFGKTTPEFVLRMLTDIFPFSEICKREDGRRELTKALDLCFLTGTDPQNPQAQGLPQGTPISPMLTNLMMISIDHALTKRFREYQKLDLQTQELVPQPMVYTRYADDLLITCRQGFSSDEAQQIVNEVLAYFHAPFAIKPEKTRYGSSSGSNWNLGLMLNKDNQITIGHQKKKHFHAMVNNYILDRLNGSAWPLDDIMQLRGLISYYKMVEKAVIEGIITHYDQKYRVDTMAMIKADIAA